MFGDLHRAIATRLTEKTLMQRNRGGDYFCLVILLWGNHISAKGNHRTHSAGKLKDHESAARGASNQDRQLGLERA